MLNILFDNAPSIIANGVVVSSHAMFYHVYCVFAVQNASGNNLEVMLCALDSLLVTCLAPSSSSSSLATTSLTTQESAVHMLVLTVRALAMRRNILKTKHQPSSDSSSGSGSVSGALAKTWQESFLQLIFRLMLLQTSADTAAASSSASLGVGAAVTLALVGKHVHQLSCDSGSGSGSGGGVGKEGGVGFLSTATSNTTSMMWRQKLWHQCFPSLTTTVQQATSLSTADHHPTFTQPADLSPSLSQPIASLLCLLGLAAEMPLAVVQDHLPDLISYSVQALMVNDPASQHSNTVMAPNVCKSSDKIRGDKDCGGDEDEAEADILFAHVRTVLRHAAVQCLLSACQSSRPAIVEALRPHLSTLIPLLLQVKRGGEGERERGRERGRWRWSRRSMCVCVGDSGLFLLCFNLESPPLNLTSPHLHMYLLLSIL